MSSGARFHTVQSVYADSTVGQQQRQMGPGTRRAAEARGYQSGLQHVVSFMRRAPYSPVYPFYYREGRPCSTYPLYPFSVYLYPFRPFSPQSGVMRSAPAVEDCLFPVNQHKKGNEEKQQTLQSRITMLLYTIQPIFFYYGPTLNVKLYG